MRTLACAFLALSLACVGAGAWAEDNKDKAAGAADQTGKTAGIGEAYGRHGRRAIWANENRSTRLLHNCGLLGGQRPKREHAHEQRTHCRNPSKRGAGAHFGTPGCFSFKMESGIDDCRATLPDITSSKEM